ncbi:restriction endonuclease subunit S [Patescibacteria group bacterium]|nr:restriction endonuclease subunit S [Patescibacteria group bacterium]MBU4455161.1 restriction endonuclease subunit S [Patescibacteria group bacterium]
MVKKIQQKTNWQTKKLGEVCDIGAGNSAPQKKEFFVGGIYPFFRTSDVGKIHIGNILESSDYLNEKGIKGLKLFNKGIILLPKSGASTFLNHRVVLGTDGYVSSHLATIKTDEEILNNSFLFYFLQGIKAQDLIQDHKYPSLNLPVIGEIEIYYPESLSEQHRIVKILDEVFADVAKAKENAEKNLQNAKDLFESYSQDVFAKSGKGWKEKKLGDILEIERGGSPRPIQKYLTNDANGINWIKIGDTKNIDKYILKTRQKIKPEGLKKTRLVNSGDFILSNSMSFGRPYIMKITGAIHDGWLVLREKNINVIDKDYLYNILGSPYVFGQFDKLAAGSTVRNLNISLVSSVKIPLPLVVEQKSIVKKLDVLYAETKKLEVIYKQKLADLEELKKAVLKKAFSGKL